MRHVYNRPKIVILFVLLVRSNEHNKLEKMNKEGRYVGFSSYLE